MIHEIVYTESRTSNERRFLIDMTLAAYQSRAMACAVLSEAHVELPETSKFRGVDVSRVCFSNPDNLKQARDILEVLVRSGAVGLVIVEGFAGLLTPSYENLITNLAEKTGTSLLFAR